MVLRDMAQKRDWQPREQRLVSEFLFKEYPTTPYMTRVRLGSYAADLDPVQLAPAEIRMLTVRKRWADALILLKEKTIIVEGAIRSDPGDISKLEIYARLFVKTPEFKDRWTLPLELMLIYAIEDPVAVELAREKGIRCIPFRPDWIDDYLRLLAGRERRAPKAARLGGP